MRYTAITESGRNRYASRFDAESDLSAVVKASGICDMCGSELICVIPGEIYPIAPNWPSRDTKVTASESAATTRDAMANLDAERSAARIDSDCSRSDSDCSRSAESCSRMASDCDSMVFKSCMNAGSSSNDGRVISYGSKGKTSGTSGFEIAIRVSIVSITVSAIAAAISAYVLLN